MRKLSNSAFRRMDGIITISVKNDYIRAFRVAEELLARQKDIDSQTLRDYMTAKRKIFAELQQDGFSDTDILTYINTITNRRKMQKIEFAPFRD